MVKSTTMQKKTVAVIGAGVTGLTLARELASRYECTVFEKSRGLGGRLATRYRGYFQFDHGAPFFHLQSGRLADVSPVWQSAAEEKALESWEPVVYAWDGSASAPIAEVALQTMRVGSTVPADCWVGAPKMNQIGKYLAALAEESGVALQRGVRVASIERVNRDTSGSDAQPEQWRLMDEQGGVFGDFDWVLSAAPMEQAYALLPTSFEHRHAIAQRPMQGGYSLMLGWNNAEQLPWAQQSWQVLLNHAPVRGEDRVLARVVRDSRKPQRSEYAEEKSAENAAVGEKDTAVSLLIQSTPEWADQHIDDDQEAVKQQLLKAASEILGMDAATVDHSDMHRWRYAGVATAGHVPFYLDEGNRLAAAGDWCLAGNVASAEVSAQALAAALLARAAD